MAAEAPAQIGGDIQVRVPELRQLFDPMDPSPLARKDLHPRVDEFVVSWGREIPWKASPALVLHLGEPVGEDELRDATAAIHDHFLQRARVTERQLRRLFEVGRVSLVIAIIVLTAAITAGEMLASGADASRLRQALGGTLEIGGWVAMWRPLEIFLYEWWPIRADIRLFHRLAGMPVRLTGKA